MHAVQHCPSQAPPRLTCATTALPAVSGYAARAQGSQGFGGPRHLPLLQPGERLLLSPRWLGGRQGPSDARAWGMQWLALLLVGCSGPATGAGLQRRRLNPILTPILPLRMVSSAGAILTYLSSPRNQRRAGGVQVRGGAAIAVPACAASAPASRPVLQRPPAASQLPPAARLHSLCRGVAAFCPWHSPVHTAPHCSLLPLTAPSAPDSCLQGEWRDTGGL